MSNQKVLPLPGELATPTVPPIASASWATKASPSPLPPKRRVSVGSTWENIRNNRPVGFARGLSLARR